MEDVYRYINDHLEESLAELKEFCSLPSVSAHGTAIQETAEYVSRLLESCGFQAQIIDKSNKAYPVVCGQRGGKSKHTLLFYDHYDVQPPEPLELWTTPPFEPMIRDGKLYGRGVCDNKGNISARLAAIRAITAVHGDLPCTVKFCIEGDEEIGSPQIEPFVEKHKDLLEADACIWEGMGVSWQGVPKVVLGVKGLLYVELEAKGAALDLHSSYGTVVPNPAWRLAWALATIKDKNERVLIDGFYDDVRPPTEQELAAVKAMPDEANDALRSYKLESFVKNLQGLNYRLQHIFEPTATINGFLSGYIGPGPKTVLPSQALLKMDFRLVPEQDPHDILQKLRDHLDRNGFEDISLQVLGSEHPYRTSVSHPWVKIVTESVSEVYKVRPSVEPNMAGTGPLYPFARVLKVPTADCGVGYPGSHVHAPNENIRTSDFLDGAKVIAAIINRFAQES